VSRRCLGLSVPAAGVPPWDVWWVPPQPMRVSRHGLSLYALILSKIGGHGGEVWVSDLRKSWDPWFCWCGKWGWSHLLAHLRQKDERSASGIPRESSVRRPQPPLAQRRKHGSGGTILLLRSAWVPEGTGCNGSTRLYEIK
jgi:hypothetical protein